MKTPRSVTPNTDLHSKEILESMGLTPNKPYEIHFPKKINEQTHVINNKREQIPYDNYWFSKPL